jgi:hypothetical protein
MHNGFWWANCRTKPLTRTIRGWDFKKLDTFLEVVVLIYPPQITDKWQDFVNKSMTFPNAQSA